MAKISLGSMTLSRNPSKMSLINARRRSAMVDTYDGIAFFTWGTILDGVQVVMEWPFMKTGTFASLDNFLQLDSSLVLNPQDGSGHTYNAEILSLEGEYHRGLSVAANTYRTNIKMTLVITSRV